MCPCPVERVVWLAEKKSVDSREEKKKDVGQCSQERTNGLIFKKRGGAETSCRDRELSTDQ